MRLPQRRNKTSTSFGRVNHTKTYRNAAGSRKTLTESLGPGAIGISKTVADEQHRSRLLGVFPTSIAVTTCCYKHYLQK
jgi:hypothetical protein